MAPDKMSTRLLVASFLSAVKAIHCIDIAVTNGETAGLWRPMETCPLGSKAYGYDTQNDLTNRPVVDNTALNTIRLYCDDPLDTNITSFPGESGTWGIRLDCPSGGFLVGFQLRVSPNGNTSDDTAASNIHFKCNNGRYLNGAGNDYGFWGDWSDDCPDGICGIQSRYNPLLPLVDNTALNDVRFECC